MDNVKTCPAFVALAADFANQRVQEVPRKESFGTAQARKEDK